MTDNYGTVKGVLWNAAAFTVSYSLLNYLIPNDCINYFTKSFFATSGILVSGILNSYVYTKVSGKTIWQSDTKENQVISSEITEILNANEEKDVEYQFTIGNYIVSLVYDDLAELITLSVSKNAFGIYQHTIKHLDQTSSDKRLELSWKDGKLFIQSPLLTVVKVNVVNLSA